MSASSRPTRAPDLLEAGREVGRDRRLSDATFSGGDGDDVADVRHDLIVEALFRTGLGVEVGIQADVRYRFPDLVSEIQLRRRERGVERERNRRRPRLLVDVDVVYEPHRDDVLADEGVLDLPEPRFEFRFEFGHLIGSITEGERMRLYYPTAAAATVEHEYV